METINSAEVVNSHLVSVLDDTAHYMHRGENNLGDVSDVWTGKELRESLVQLWAANFSKYTGEDEIDPQIWAEEEAKQIVRASV